MKSSLGWVQEGMNWTFNNFHKRWKVIKYRMKVLYQNNQKFDFEVHGKKSINWKQK